MNEIVSHHAIAQRVATEIDHALNTVIFQPKVTIAKGTTVKGNEAAYETVNLHQQAAQVFVSALAKDIENIRSVADEFERMDKNLIDDIRFNHVK